MKTAALILAAGSSSRLGQSKQLLDWGGRPLLEVVVKRCQSWDVDEVWVVLGHEADASLDGCDLNGTSVVINDGFEEGIASSLRVGLDSLTRHSKADAALVVMGDQPAIDATVIPKLKQAAKVSRSMAVIPKYRYIRSNPVLVTRDLWPRLMSLAGDQGAQKLLDAHPEWVEEVWLEALPPRDIDTRADVDEMQPRSPV